MIESTPTILLYLHSSPLIRHCSSWTEPLDPLDTTIELSSIHKGLTRATSNNIRIDPDPETVQFQIQIQENEDRRMDDNSLSPNHRSSSTSSSSSSSTTHTTINNDLSLISITATPDSFSSILTTFGATILHYGGHSTLAGGMLFEDEQGTGEAREVMPEKLPELVPQPSTSTSSSPKLVRGESTSLKQIVHQSTKLVFLSSCYSSKAGSQFADQLLVPHVIATETKVRDESIKDFVQKFYESLFSGKTVAASFNRAKTIYDINNVLDACPWILIGSGDHENAVLFPEGRIGRTFTNRDIDTLSHDKRKNENSNVGKDNSHFFLERWKAYAPRRPLTINFPRTTNDNNFVGRNALIAETLKVLRLNKLVSITSGTRGGIGKSELVGKIGEFEGQRRGGRWNYIVYVDCNTVYKIIKSVVDSDEQVEVEDLYEAIARCCDSSVDKKGKNRKSFNADSNNNNNNNANPNEDNGKTKTRSRSRSRSKRIYDIDSTTTLINFLVYLKQATKTRKSTSSNPPQPPLSSATATTSAAAASASASTSPFSSAASAMFANFSRAVSTSSGLTKNNNSGRLFRTASSESKLDVDSTTYSSSSSDECSDDDDTHDSLSGETRLKKVLFIFDDFERLVSSPAFALAGFTLVNELFLCEDFDCHMLVSSTDNFSLFYSSFLKRQKPSEHAGGVKFVGIDHNTPEKSIICPRLEDYFCGLVVTKHLDRKLFYTEMMSPSVRGLIEGKSKTPNDYNPLEWMMMLSARPSVAAAEGKPGALISLARNLQNNKMDDLDQELLEGEDSASSLGYLNERSGGSEGSRGETSDRSILEGLEKWIKDSTLEVQAKLGAENDTRERERGRGASHTRTDIGAENNNKNKIVDPWCITLWAKICYAANKKSKESVINHRVSWPIFVAALERIIRRWTKVEHGAQAPGGAAKYRELTSAEKEFLKGRMDHFRSKGQRRKSADGGGESELDGERAKWPINFQDFVLFCSWLSPTLKTLNSISSEWQTTTTTGSRVLIHGFVGRVRAVEMLKEMSSAGVFLIRFSESNPGWLVISFNDEEKERKSKGGGSTTSTTSTATRVISSNNHCLVSVADNGFTIYFQKGRRKYGKLSELIAECKKLKYLWNEKGEFVDKRDCFGGEGVVPTVYAFSPSWDGNSSNGVSSRGNGNVKNANRKWKEKI